MHTELTDGVLHVVMDDGKANAINGALLDGLERAADQAEGAGAALVIEGRAGVLSGGLDLKLLPTLEASVLHATLLRFGAVMLRLFTFPRPVVVASTGHALAGGAVLLLAGDARVGTRGAYKIGLNETAIGFRLPRFVVEMARAHLASQHAFDAITAATIYAPDDAQKVGYYTEVVDHEALRSTAISRARALAWLPAETYAQNKAHLRDGPAQAGRAAYEAEMETFRDAVIAARRS